MRLIPNGYMPFPTPGDEPMPDTQMSLDELHGLIGHYARQLFDAQKQRIMAGNRVAAMERDGLSAYAEPARAIVAEYEAIERGIDRELTRYARQHFMASWIAEQRGIGLPGFGRLLGVTGNIDRFPTVSKLWKYLGLHVVDGHAPKRVKGESWTHTDCKFWHLRTCKPDCATNHHPSCVSNGVGTAYAPQGRVLCHQLGEAIVKVGGDGPYRRAYDEKKKQYEEGRPDWTQARRHNAAMRFAVKLLIRNLWTTWHVRRGHTISVEPYGGMPGNAPHHRCSCSSDGRGHVVVETHTFHASPDPAPHDLVAV